MKRAQQDTKGTLFSKVGPDDSPLYINTTPNLEWWSAIVLPKDSTYKESTISLSQATTLNVYFLFASNCSR